jgi:carboxyl-terminal processing protease
VKLRTVISVSVAAILVASLFFFGVQGARYLWVLTTPSGRAFLQALHEIRDHHLSRPNSSVLLNGAIAGMTASLNDPFTEYQAPLDERGSSSLLVNDIGEVGLRIKALNPNGTGSRIVSVRSISPAADAGIRAEDILVNIDGQATASMNTVSIAQKLLGTRGSICKVVIQRGATSKTFLLTRDNVYAKTVTAFKLSADIGYIRISDFFNQNTALQFKTALQELRSSNAKKLVLDLRDNGGGRIDQASAVADTLLNQGAIFTTRDQNGIITTRQQATETPDDDTRPLVILVNHGTASASEILAAALQGNTRAKLIGETTYGKGVANTENNLADGSKLILSSTEWLTPNGKNINTHGLEPDQKITDTRFTTPMTLEAKHLPPNSSVSINTNGKTIKLTANAKGEVQYSTPETWVNWSAPRDASRIKRDAQLQAAIKTLQLEPPR